MTPGLSLVVPLCDCCFSRLILSSVVIEILLAITAIAVTAVYNISVLGRFLDVRFACNAKLPVQNNDAFISCKSLPPIEIGEASIHNFLYFRLIGMNSQDMPGQVLHRKKAEWAAAAYLFV